MSRRRWAVLAAGCVCLVSSGTVPAAENGGGVPSPEALRELSVEDLMQIKVTTLLRKPASLERVPAALHVLTGEEIRRSGVRSLPDALSLIPGLTVARIDAYTWAITARGFNSSTANKLEVLMDGRSLYTPLYSGVFWDVQDTLLEDVARIEVIRGPGAALWGANAVNGVVNIVTHKPEDTQGSYVTVGAGQELRGVFGARHGGRLRGGAAYRVYAKLFEADGSVSAGGGDAPDDWRMARSGFRIGWVGTEGGSWNLQGDAYTGSAGDLVTVFSPDPLRAEARVGDTRLSGGNLLASWSRPTDRGDLKLQTYLDSIRREIPDYFVERRATVDLDFQARSELGSRHELLWGFGYRLSRDRITNTFSVSWSPPRRDLHLASFFVQDEIVLSPRRLSLVLGGKLEHNDYTGFEAQPTVRLLWRPDDRNTLWTAVSRAVRTPTRLEREVRLGAGVLPSPAPGAPPSLLALVGDRAVVAEELLAYELGYRVRPRPSFSCDVAAFYNDYDEVVSFTGPGTPFAEGAHLLVPFSFANLLAGESYGAELTAAWQVGERWRISGGASVFRLRLEAKPGRPAPVVDAPANDPEWQALVRVAWSLAPSGFASEAILHYVDELSGLGVDADFDVDLHLSWKMPRGFELSLRGENLLDERHVEFGPGANEIERGVSAFLSWRR